MVREWFANGSQMVRKWFANGSRMVREWFGNGSGSARMASGNFEKRGTRRSASGGNEARPSAKSTAIRSAFANSTLVRLTRYVPPLTCTQGSNFNKYRGVIDIIFGDVLVVVARFRATAVVTLLCNRLSLMLVTRMDGHESWKLNCDRKSVHQEGQIHPSKCQGCGVFYLVSMLFDSMNSGC